MKKVLALILALATLFTLAACASNGEQSDPSSKDPANKPVKIGYISPDSDTWYLRAEEGARWACEKANAEFKSVNSHRDSEQEIANIEQLINEGVDCIVMLSWNEAGCVACAQMCKEANIGCVIFDACGAMAKHEGLEYTAAVDFDWASMGDIYAEWMNKNYPGEGFAFINGTLDSLVCQNLALVKEASEKIGSNHMVDMRYCDYNPENAANEAEDLVNSGLDFSIIGTCNEDCAAAVITRLQDMGVKDKYHVFSQNGSETGIKLLKDGTLEFTIASSPGLEAAVSVFAGIDYVRNGGEKNRQISCPIASATTENADDPYAVIPWAVNEEVWINIIRNNFSEYAYFFN